MRHALILAAIVACMGAEGCPFGGPLKQDAAVIPLGGCGDLDAQIGRECGAQLAVEAVAGADCLQRIMSAWNFGDRADGHSRRAVIARVDAVVCMAAFPGCRVTATYSIYHSDPLQGRVLDARYPAYVVCADIQASLDACAAKVAACFNG